MWNEINKSSRERSICPSIAPHTMLPQPDNSKLPQFQYFHPQNLQASLIKGKVQQTISQYHVLRTTTPSKYTMKGATSLCKLLEPTNEIRGKTEDAFSRYWIFINICVKECPSPFRAWAVPRRHVSSTNIMFTSTTQTKTNKQKCTSTLMSPFFYSSSKSNTQLVVYMSKAHVHKTHSSTRLCATTDHSTYTHRKKTRKKKSNKQQKEAFKEKVW